MTEKEINAAIAGGSFPRPSTAVPGQRLWWRDEIVAWRKETYQSNRD
jgi:hypothetical protein